MSVMAGWASNYLKPKKSGGLDGNEMVMGLVLSQKSGLELMQNCDLPPPVKVFAGPDKAVLSSMNRVYDMVVQEDDENDEPGSGTENEKLELLKALRLSQTRAREAEKKAAALVDERDRLLNAFLEDSSRLFGYRQWVKLLELQLSRLQRQQQQQWQFCSGCHRSYGLKGSSSNEDEEEEEEEKDAADDGGMTWFVAIALCLGIAGVGFAFGCRYFFFF